MNKPAFESIPLADGLRWRAGNGRRFEEKLDGRFHLEELPHATVAGELMRGGQFIAFDVLNYEGQDTRSLPLCERLTILDAMKLPRPATGSGGEFLEAVLARGGEGVIAKRLAGCRRLRRWRDGLLVLVAHRAFLLVSPQRR